MATATYYFNARNNNGSFDEGAGLETSLIVDGNLGTCGADNNNGHYVTLTGNDCPGTNLGTISSVTCAVLWANNSTLANIKFTLTPYFGGSSAGDNHQPTADVGAAGSEAWSDAFNITSDTNAPSPWSWTDVQNLDCRLTTVRGTTGQWKPYSVRIVVTYVGSSASLSASLSPSTTPSLSISLSPSLSISSSPSISESASESLSLSPSASPSVSVSLSPSLSISVSPSSSFSLSISLSPSLSISFSPSLSPSASQSPSLSPSLSISSSPSVSISSSISLSESLSSSFSSSLSISLSPSSSESFSISFSPSLSISSSPSVSESSSQSPSSSESLSFSLSPSFSASVSPSVSSSLSTSVSESRSPSITPSSSVSLSPSGSEGEETNETNYVVKVAKIGKNADSTNPNDFIFHSSYNTFKIVKEGTETYEIPANTTDEGTFGFTHGLSYIPMVTAFLIEDGVDQVIAPNTVNIDLWGAKLGWTSTGVKFVRVRVDSESVGFLLHNETASAVTVRIRYFCFEKI